MNSENDLLFNRVRELESLYKEKNNIDKRTNVLNPSTVSCTQLKKLQYTIGYQLVPELQALYQFANGSLIGASGDHALLFATHKFNTIESSLSTIQELTVFNQTARQSEYDEGLTGRLYKDYYCNHKLGAIQHMEFHPHWFPLGNVSGMSTYIMVDHAPAENGVHGQVIFIDLGRKAIVLADSLMEYLNILAKKYSYASHEEDDYRIMLKLAKGGFWKSIFSR